jgi:hypothetical protein
MSSYERTITRYRDYSIRLNPLETPEGALSDAFHISRPGPHPEADIWRYEYPNSDVKKDYPSESAAREAALKIAKAWIDKEIDSHSA